MDRRQTPPAQLPAFCFENTKREGKFEHPKEAGTFPCSLSLSLSGEVTSPFASFGNLKDLPTLGF
jgi:hypothetical protein